jgi:large conductance mechanosensitive channel
MEPNDRPRLTKAEHKRRRVKEVKTKLSNLSPTAAAEVVNEALATQARKQVGGFAQFIRDQGVVGVGIGLVLGVQIKAVVDTIMAQFVNPITALLPGGLLSSRTFKMTIGAKQAVVGWGAIVYSLFTFLMVALIIYGAYKFFRLEKLKKEK